MLSALILRSSLRPCLLSRCFGTGHSPAPPPRAPLTASCPRGGGGKRHDAARSILHPDTQVSSFRPSVRRFVTASGGEDGRLIYTGTWGNSIRWLKMFSYGSSAITVGVMPHLVLTSGLGVDGFVLQALMCGVVGLYAVLSPVFFHLVTKGYVLRLYHRPDGDTYTAVTVSVFLTEKRTVFHQRDVRVPAVSKIFTSFHANGAGLLVFPDYFQPHDYNHLMGYDKPFTFHADDLDGPSKS